MERDDFLKELQATARQLQRKFPKNGADWVSAICSGKADAKKKLEVDAVYELMCCFAILAGMEQRGVALKCITAEGPNGFRFPMKPGHKAAFAFFRFEDDGASYDVCCGTKIPTQANAEPSNDDAKAEALRLLDDDDPDEAPDISLQKHGGVVGDDYRECGTPIALWDAKFHKKAASKSDVEQMNWWCDIFEIPKCCADDILSKVMPELFQVSAVITNAPLKKFNKRQCLKRRFSVVFDYAGVNDGCACVPTRAEHIAAA